MANKKGKDINLSPAQMVQPGVEKAAAMGDGKASSASGESLEEEYYYVIADLKRIGVIAVVMLAVLIALVLLLA